MNRPAETAPGQAEDDPANGTGFDGRPSKSLRKRQALAAQALGTRLIALREKELQALDLPETLYDAVVLARGLHSRGGLARQRQYIGKLMRDIDTAAIEAKLARQAEGPAIDAEKLRRIEQWRARLLAEGSPALAELLQWRPALDRPRIELLMMDAVSPRRTEAQRTQASRALFRALREALD